MTEKIAIKHPIWESSVRPLYPKCVWIDGGSYRNFILDHDIQRRHTDELVGLNGLAGRRALSCDDLEEDMQSLKLIGLASDVRIQRHDAHPIVSTHMDAGERMGAYGDTKSDRGVDSELMTDKSVMRVSCADDVVFGKEHRQQSQSNGVGKSDAGDDIDQSKNQLTERVLQWLDLAGRQTTVRHESESMAKMPPKRRISTASEAYSRRNSMTPMMSANAKYATVPAIQPLPPLKRIESVHHLSLTFNKDDVQPPLLMPSNVPTMVDSQSVDRTALSFGEFFPTTYRCSRKFLTYRNGGGGSRARNLLYNQSRSMGQQSDPPAAMATTRRTLNKQPKRTDSIENQYRSMIQRQILETNCNTQLAKKQLHIFMPSLSKKTTLTTVMNSNVGGDCDSCLSTILSSSVAR